MMKVFFFFLEEFPSCSHLLCFTRDKCAISSLLPCCTILLISHRRREQKAVHRPFNQSRKFLGNVRKSLSKNQNP